MGGLKILRSGFDQQKKLALLQTEPKPNSIMKKHLLFFILNLLIIKSTCAQVICVLCYNQNDSIGINVGPNNLIANGGF